MGLLDRFKRRRRTFSSNFSSYRNPRTSTRKPFEPKGEVRPRKTGFLAKLVLTLKIGGILGAILAIVYAIFFTKLFEIQKINITGGNDTLEEQSTLNASFQEYLGKSLITLNVPLIETQLLKEYPYLKTMDVRRDFFHTLTVLLETFENKANVRIDYEDDTQQFFVVNEEGYISGAGISEENLPVIVMDVSGTEATLPMPEEASQDKNRFNVNEELIPKKTLEILLETTKDFEGKFNMQILEIHYLKQARELHLLTERHFTVWLDLTEDINIQLTKLKKALTTLNIYEANLDYIDLRISGQNGEKVIYKLGE